MSAEAAVLPDPRRILIAAPEWYPARRSGFARVATDTARGLAERGHRVTVVTARNRSLASVSVEGNVTLLSRLPRRPVPAVVGDVLALAAFARRRGDDFDAFLAHGPTAALGLELGLRSRPVTYVYHSPHAEELRVLAAGLDTTPGRARAIILSHLSGRIEAAAVARATTLVVLSDFIGRRLEAVHGVPEARVVKATGGVDVERFSPGDGRLSARGRLGLDPEGRLLFTVRRLEPRMGLENLIEALHLLPEADRPSLAIAGIGPLAARLERVAAANGLSHRVRLLGAISDEELVDWYRAADLFVLPTTALEGFGMVTAEALASGTPVVGTPVGATPELLTSVDPRLVARGTSPAELADAIQYGLAADAEALARRARAYAEASLDWRRVIVEWEAALFGAGGDPHARTSPSHAARAGEPRRPVGRADLGRHRPDDLL